MKDIINPDTNFIINIAELLGLAIAFIKIKFDKNKEKKQEICSREEIKEMITQINNSVNHTDKSQGTFKGVSLKDMTIETSIRLERVEKMLENILEKKELEKILDKLKK